MKLVLRNNYFLKFSVIIFLFFLFSMVLQANVSKTLLQNKSKLGVLAVVFPATVHQAKKIYKNELFARYQKEAAQKKITLQQEQLEERYVQEYSTSAFLKAYGRYLKDSFVGSMAWKKEHIWFVNSIYGAVIAACGAYCLDFALNRSTAELSRPNVLLNIAQDQDETKRQVIELVTLAHNNWGLLKQDQKDDIKSLDSMLKKAPVKIMNNRVKIATLISQIKSLDGFSLEPRAISLLPVRLVAQTPAEVAEQFSDLKELAQRNWDLLKPEQRHIILNLHMAQKAPIELMNNRELIIQLLEEIKPLDLILLDRRRPTESVFPVARVRRPRMSSQEAVRQYVQNYVNALLAELERQVTGGVRQPEQNAQPISRCAEKPLHQDGCCVCMKGAAANIKELQEKIVAEKQQAAPNVAKIKELEDELAEEKACRNSYVLPCQNKVAVREDGSPITACKGAQVCCDECMEGLLKSHHYHCPSCRESFKPQE